MDQKEKLEEEGEEVSRWRRRKRKGRVVGG